MGSSSQLAATRTNVENALRAIVGRDHVCAGELILVEPIIESEVAAVLRYANDHGLCVLPHGNSTKAEWGNPPSRADIVLSTKRMDRILEHAWADLTVTVEAGCTINNLQNALAQHGQRLAIDPFWPERTTIGGLISTNESGSLRLRFGSVRDLIIGVTLALPDGTLASSGGKVVKNVAGYDLPKLVTGAMGTLGVITRAVFRLHPLPQNCRTLTIPCADMKEAQRLLLQIQDSKLAHTALQLRIDSEAAPPDLDILFEGTVAGLDAQEQQLQKLSSPVKLEASSDERWKARQALWKDATCAIAKISVLPSEIANAVQALQSITASNQSRWAAVFQAIGIGTLSLSSPDPHSLHSALTALRSDLENTGGSLVLLRRFQGLPAFDAWGATGDAQALMSAVKQQFDPKRILNPGRFLGGI
jgi:glycolate dehydrogenase FAD-binding subunit